MLRVVAGPGQRLGLVDCRGRVRPVESPVGPDGKRRVVVIVEDRDNARPAAGHVLGAPRGHRGSKAILERA